MSAVSRDFSLAFRRLASRPGITALAVAMLALAIGFSTAAFSLLDAWFWRALPVAEPGRLMYAQIRDREDRPNGFTWREFETIQRETASIAAIAVENRQSLPVRLPDRDDFPVLAGVSDNYFDVLGVRAARGRTFHAGDAADGQVVLSDRYWHSAFGGDPGLVGRSIAVGPASLTVIGIFPPGFAGSIRGVAVDLFVPEETTFGSLRLASRADGRRSDYEPAVLRLKPGVSRDTARAQINQALRRMEAAGAAPEPGRRVLVASFENPGGQETGNIFLAILLLVLVIAAANLATLRLVDNATRRRDTGIRLALGAGRFALVRQHLAECLATAGISTALGLLLAAWIVDAAPAVLYAGARWNEYFVRMDGRVFAFSAGALLLVAVIGALIPVRDAWRAGVLPALRAVSSPKASRWLAALVIIQMALVTAVGNSAGLLWGSLRRVAAIRPAMDPARRMLIVAGSYPDEQAGPAEVAGLGRELSGIPGVARVAYARRAMLSGSGVGRRTAFERPGEPKQTFRFNQVSPNYFAATGARVLLGRPFADGDGPQATPVVMVSQAFVRKFFGSRAAVGEWIRLDGKDREIVGVVEDGPSARLREEIEPFVYFPFDQRPSGDVTYFIETATEPGVIAQEVRQHMRRAGSRYLAMDFRTMARHMAIQRSEEELALKIAGGMGLLGTLLAAAGLFSVAMYAVSRRTREFGIRLALGATGTGLAREVALASCRLAGVGVPLGCALALASSRLIGGVLYGVSATSAWTLIAAAAAVMTVSVVASVAPARRAARIQPVDALRQG